MQGDATRHSTGITVRTIGFADLSASLAAGMDDFRAAPRTGLIVGCGFTIGGLAVVALATSLGMPWFAYPLAAGFVLLGPFAALALYEVSRRREAGLTHGPGDVIRAVITRAEVKWLSFVTLFIFIIWMYQVRLLIALFLGINTSFATFREFLQAVVTTPEGIVFLLIGNVIGAALSLVTFTLTVVSFPMLLDRDVDFVTAMITSVRSVMTNPLVMLGWGIAVTLLLLLSVLSAFVALTVILPWLGHSTWHLYRKLIVPAP
jgi:uncharacterized membrane protein